MKNFLFRIIINPLAWSFIPLWIAYGITKKRLLKILAIIFTVIGTFMIVVTCVISFSPPEIPTEQKVAITEEEEQHKKGDKGNPYPMNEIVMVGEIEWEIITAENTGYSAKVPGIFFEKKITTNETFIQVKLKVKNVGSKPITITNLNLYLVDNKDRKFKPCYTSLDFPSEDINPGIARTYTLIYEVPLKVEGLLIEITSLRFMGKKAYISLEFD